MWTRRGKWEDGWLGGWYEEYAFALKKGEGEGGGGREKGQLAMGDVVGGGVVVCVLLMARRLMMKCYGF